MKAIRLIRDRDLYHLYIGSADVWLDADDMWELIKVLDARDDYQKVESGTLNMIINE